MAAFWYTLVFTLFSSTWCVSDDAYGTLLQLRVDMHQHAAYAESRLHELMDRVDELYDRYKPGSGTRAEYEVAGFTAVKNDIQDINSGNTVTFTQVLHNYQGGYDPNTSRYTCPYHSVYYVTASLERERDVETAIYVNNIRQVSLKDTRVTGAIGIEYNSVTNSMIIECDFDQQIWVEATGNGRILGSEQDSERTSVFTVLRLNDPFPGQVLPTEIIDSL